MPKRDWLDTSPRFWRSPLAIAGSAGAIGLVAGAMFAGVFAKPTPSQSTDVAAATIAAAPSAKQAETTGASSLSEAAPPAAAHAAVSATNETGQASASGDCERQAWPYMTQKCQAEREAGQRKVRVITTDRLAAPLVNAIETQSPPRTRVEDKPVPQVAVAPAVKAEAPTVAVAQSTPPVAKASTEPVVEPVAASAAPETSAPVAVTPTPQQQRATARAERRKAAQDAREQRKREAKARKSLDDGEVDTRRVSSRGEQRRGRIVERWTEREYNVRSEDGLGRRTVVVRSGRDGLSYAPETETRRSNPLFSIFGN